MYRFLWPLRLGWLLVCCRYKEVYLQIFKRVSFLIHGCCGEWMAGPVDQLNHTSWEAVITPTDHPKSVRNRCEIEPFFGVVCVFTLPFWHFCWRRGFCHRTESDLFLFLLPWCFSLPTKSLWMYSRWNTGKLMCYPSAWGRNHGSLTFGIARKL